MDSPSSEPEPTRRRSRLPPSPGPSESGRRQHRGPVLLEEHPKTRPVPTTNHSEGLDALTRAPPSQVNEHRPREQSGQHDGLLSLLRRKLHDLTEIVDVFVSKLEERSDRVEELTKLNAALESDVKQQKDEISRIKAQLVDERSERILFQTESKRAAEAKLEEKRREFARLLGDKDDDLASLQGKLEESEKQGQARVEEGKQQLAVTNTELGDLRGQIKTLKAQRENLKKDLEAQTSRVNALETERQQLAKEAEEIKQTSREKEPEQNLSDVRAQLVALQAENTELRENAKKRESRIHGLKKRVGEVEVKLASLHIASKTPVPQQHDTPGLVAHASEQAGKDLDAAQSRITELEKQSSTLQHDLQDSETELSRLRSDLSKANEQIETHGRDLLNERQANEALKIREHITPEEDATTSLRVQGLSQDLKTEKSRGNRLQTELGESVAENERLKQALVDLEGRADDAMKAREEAERQLSVSQTDRDAKFMAEIERIQAELQEKGRQLSDLETRRDASIESDAQIKREIEELHGNLRDAELRYREEKRRREELLSQKAVLESKQTQLTQQVHRLTSARRQAQSDVVRNLQQEIATKEETITGLETQIQLLGTRLKDIQGFAFDLKRNAARRKIDDGFIRDRLEYEFRDGTRHWAKTWGANKFTTDLQQSDMGELRVQLQKVAEVRTDVRLVVQLEAIDPRLVVDALLSRYLVDNIFPESSNAAGGHDEVSMESALSKFLIELYKAFMHVDEPKAHSWRSQTLGLFKQSELGSVAEEDSPNKGEGTRDWHGLAQRFLEGPVRFFLKPVSSSEHQAQVEQLVELMSETADLSLYIRRQHTALQIRGFEHYQGQTFRHDSPEMELDRYHGMDPDDSRRDGDRIRMVVKPGFFAPGPANGERKVWAKAVVLLP
ncbi:hypothetical protein CNMCM8980_005664 [Aspergillus fumigatiaffinis]|nr:hypothetical protein CNMCM8980_005664 [Aspergillus fumigatiaffinis]